MTRCAPPPATWALAALLPLLAACTGGDVATAESSARPIDVATPTVPAADERIAQAAALRARIEASTAHIERTERFRALEAHHDADWTAPLDEILGHLEARADAGDLDAMHVLGSRLSGCPRVLEEGSPDILLQAYEDELGRLDGDATVSDLIRDTRLENLQGRFLQDLARHAQCDAVGPDAIGRAAEWLERAARAGHARAQTAYATQGLAQFRTRGQIVREIEEVVRRRDLARTWLEARLRAGDEAALQTYVRSHGDGNLLYSRDPKTFHAYGYALDLVRRRRVGDFDALWREGPERYGDLSDAEWAASVDEGRRIYSAFFENAAPSR